jgi:Serine dehydrogenase proteinase
MPDWKNVLQQIAIEQHRGQLAFDTIRRRYLGQMAEYTGRNVIAYYSGWQSKPGISGSEIRDEDRDGFMQCMHGLDYNKGLDLILHTPGGGIAATQSIITYLRDKFGRDIRAIIPHTAMSGGTIMACACREIIMARHSSIGPIDPQIRGIPAKGVIKEFERAFAEIRDEPQRAAVWAPILAQYSPTFIGNCENAVKWSESFTRQQLSTNMFYGEKAKKSKIDSIIQALTDYDEVKLHERQIAYKEARKTGLKIVLLEDDQDFQDVVLTVHHCYVHTLSNTPAFKIIENDQGSAFVKQMTQASA